MNFKGVVSFVFIFYNINLWLSFIQPSNQKCGATSSSLSYSVGGRVANMYKKIKPSILSYV